METQIIGSGFLTDCKDEGMRERIKKILIRLIRIMPLRDDIIMESHPDFAGNTGALYRFFLNKGVNQRHRIHWALHSGTPRDGGGGLPANVDTFYLDAHGFRQMWKRFCVLYRSRYIIDSNSYIYKRRRGQIRLHLGHGMLMKITPEYHNADKIGELDGYVVTAPFWQDVFVEKIGLPEDVILSFGYPRNDVLTGKRDTVTSLGRYVMWMPTYRQHRAHPGKGLADYFPYGMPEVMEKGQLLKLDRQAAEQKIRIYFRPHPAQDLSAMQEVRLQNIVLADDDFLRREGITLYEMLASAKALITDYSSVYYDFLLTGRPIGLTFGDSREYFRKYDCPFTDLKENIRGFYIESFEDLLQFLRRSAPEDGQAEEDLDLKRMRDRYHQYTDGRSADRIYEYMKNQYGFDGSEKEDIQAWRER